MGICPGARKDVLMRIIEVGGVFLLASAMVIDKEMHLDVVSYHGEPQPSEPLGAIVATATTLPVTIGAGYPGACPISAYRPPEALRNPAQPHRGCGFFFAVFH